MNYTHVSPRPLHHCKCYVPNISRLHPRLNFSNSVPNAEGYLAIYVVSGESVLAVCRNLRPV
jgi:hypothetical protein